MVGLHSGTHSRIVVIGGILTIAIADAFSDALGIHVAQESQNRHSTRAIWESTLVTFVIPIVLLPMDSAMVASALWGLLLLAGFSFYMARAQGVSPWGVVAEHVVIALLVIVITHYLGEWLGEMFGAGSKRFTLIASDTPRESVSIRLAPTDHP